MSKQKLMDLIDSYNRAVISLHIGMTGAAQENLVKKKEQRLLHGAETAMAELRNTIQRFKHKGQ